MADLIEIPPFTSGADTTTDAKNVNKTARAQPDTTMAVLKAEETESEGYSEPPTKTQGKISGAGLDGKVQGIERYFCGFYSLCDAEDFFGALDGFIDVKGVEGTNYEKVKAGVAPVRVRFKCEEAAQAAVEAWTRVYASGETPNEGTEETKKNQRQ